MVQRLLSSNGINGNTVMPEQNSKKLASTLLQPRESKHNQSRGGGIFTYTSGGGGITNKCRK